MADRDVTAAVFDLGGVLIDWNPRHLYRKLFDGDDAAMEAFLADVCTPEWNAELDAGKSFSEAVEALARVHPAQRDLILAYHARWDEMMPGDVPGTVAVLRDLRAAAVPLYVLSNWSRETFPVAQARFPFLRWFAGTVISGDLGRCKPDPAIFRHLLQQFGLQPERTVFVDDSAANVAVAATLGMVALRFHGPARLRADLERLGLLTPASSEAAG